MNIAALQLETARLTLRPPRLDEFEAWATFIGDPDNARFLRGPQVRQTAWRSFMTGAGAWLLQGFAMFSVLEKSSGRWVGQVSPWMPDSWPGTEVGWMIVRDCQGMGYATEAATAAIDWAFATLGWQEVIHVIDPANWASQAVARKLDSVNRGSGRLPPPFDALVVDIWGQSRAQWHARAQKEL